MDTRCVPDARGTAVLSPRRSRVRARANRVLRPAPRRLARRCLGQAMPPSRSLGENGLGVQAMRLGLLTAGDIANAAGVSRTTLYRWIEEGRLSPLPIV